MVSLDDAADSRRRTRVRWWTAGAVLVATGVGVLACWPFLVQNPVLGVINTLVAVSFTATGVIMQEERQQRTTGILLVLVAAFYLVSWGWSWPAAWQVVPLPLISYIGGYLWFVLLLLALLRYPEARLTRWWDRLAVIALGTWVVVPKTLLALVAEPEWAGFDSSVRWPTVAANEDLFQTGSTVATVGIVVIGAPMLVPLLLKVRRSRSVDRIDAVPGTVAAFTIMACGCAYLLSRIDAVPQEAVPTLRTVIGVAALFTPLAFLSSALRRSMTRAALADLVVRLTRSPTGHELQDELRQSLTDPTLTVWFWMSEEEAYIGVDDQVCADPPAGGRWPVDITSRDGSPLGMLVLDPALRRHPNLVAPAVAACGFALENYRLHADLKGQLHEVQRSRARLAEAELRGRQQIERDLHDGAQQTLLAASVSLGEARHRAEPGTELYEAIERARTDLRTATAELRGLARGIHPPVLTQSGLRPALEGVLERTGLPNRTTILDGRLSPAVEATAYFVVCEAVTNATRHAAARRLEVDVHRDGDRLRVRVVDDGVGGAEVTTGAGLANIRDRVHAIGGSLRLTSPAGGGTTVAAELPCG